MAPLTAVAIAHHCCSKREVMTNFVARQECLDGVSGPLLGAGSWNLRPENNEVVMRQPTGERLRNTPT